MTPTLPHRPNGRASGPTTPVASSRALRTAPRRARPHLALGLLLPILLGGCTATLSTIRLVAADKAVRQAQDAAADVHAPYEFGLAQRYLEKAVEESAHSAHADAIDLAREAEAHAEEAYLQATGGGRDVSQSGEDLSDREAAGEATTAPRGDRPQPNQERIIDREDPFEDEDFLDGLEDGGSRRSGSGDRGDTSPEDPEDGEDDE